MCLCHRCRRPRPYRSQTLQRCCFPTTDFSKPLAACGNTACFRSQTTFAPALAPTERVVRDQTDAEQAADSLRPAGFVHVGGSWFGPGVEGREHSEEVCVDADPGRPMNVNIRSVDAPVWRETLLMRDWLRDGADRRAEYEHLKRDLARDHRHVDAYGAAKAEWMSTALAEAEKWGAARHWTP